MQVLYAKTVWSKDVVRVLLHVGVDVWNCIDSHNLTNMPHVGSWRFELNQVVLLDVV